MNELLVLCTYVGALVAVRRKYFPIVMPLFEKARYLMGKTSVQIGVSVEQVDAELKLAYFVANKRETEMDPHQIKSFLRRCDQTETDWVLESGPDCVASSHLPSHSDVHMSALSKERIKGQPYFLEDGMSCVTLSE